MDEQVSSSSLQQRVERLEASLAGLQRAVEQLENEVRQSVPRATPIPAQVYCPRCNGGNPPNGVVCMWCGLPLTASATGAAATDPRLRMEPGVFAGPPSPHTQVPMGATASGAQQIPSPPASNEATLPGNTDGQRPPSGLHSDRDVLRRSEFWINKVGIGLLLLGLAFLFKYSLDQGWLNDVLVPPVRIAFGLVLGSLLLVFGLRMHSRRRHYSQVLMGSSVASYYITGFASYELLHVAPYWLAFAFIVAVTLLAFALAIWQNESILSLIGTAGALATPFVLRADSHEISGLVSYIDLVLAGTSAIYLVRGWRSLLWTAFAGGWLALSIAYWAAFISSSSVSPSDRWIFQAGVIWALLMFWAVPVIREILWTRKPGRWPYPTYPSTLPEGTDSLARGHVYLAAILTSLIAAAYTYATWDISSEAHGAMAVTAAAIYGLVAWGLRKAYKNLAYMHTLLGLLFLTIGIALLLHGPVLMLTLALEATALHFIARRVADRGLALSGHIIAFVTALFLTTRLLMTHSEEMAVFNGTALAELGTIAPGLVASFALTGRAVLIYRLLVHVAFLGWLWRELSALDNGNGYVTVTWGIYALALLIAGISLGRNRFLMYTGLGTLFLVVAKLFLVDLVLVDTIWRILLFLGFGGLFLVLSYYLQNLMRPQREPRAPARLEE